MNENYLLHNETAKKLYFEYASGLPMIAFCSDDEVDDKIYNNITEAFLTNDCYKLDAMRAFGIDEKFISGDASDYEKFKKFCSILPEFAGNPIYLISQIELSKNFDCCIEINQYNCDEIWKGCNEYIAKNRVTERYLLKKSSVDIVGCLELNESINSLYLRGDVKSFDAFEKALQDEISVANVKGIKNAILTLGDDFIKPNPYSAGEIYKKYLGEQDKLSLDEFRLLSIQIIRDMGIICKRLSWNWMYEYYEPSHELLSYLEKNNALPSINRISVYDTSESAYELENDIKELAMKACLGRTICTVDFSSCVSAYARNDYLRRIICNVIGKWVEYGEYTSDENVLKRLIEDILYNNLKEAIS